jgi:hypothetical protein
MRATCHAHLILLGLIILTIFGEEKIYEAPHYTGFSKSLLFHPSPVQTFHSAPYSQITSVHIPPLMSDPGNYTDNEVENSQCSNYSNQVRPAEISSVFIPAFLLHRMERYV